MKCNRMIGFIGILAPSLCWSPLAAQAAPAGVRIDLSVCRGVYQVLQAMRRGMPRDSVTRMLDTLIATPA